jgi:hypothetical protein
MFFNFLFLHFYDADVYDLEETQENFEILMKRMENLDDYNTYYRIINDFDIFLNPNLRKTIISKGIEAFGPEFGQDLDEYVYDLEVTHENFEILMERIENRSELSVFRRLLFDFDDFLTPEIRKRVISNLCKVFGKDIIEIWNIEI